MMQTPDTQQPVPPVSAEVRIEDAVFADIPALVALLSILFSIEADFAVDSDKQAQGLAMLMASPDSAVIKVARATPAGIVGMVSAQLVISTAEGAPSAWIEDLVVAPVYQSCGVGKALLSAALDWSRAQGATRAQLLVDTANPPALAFYTHLGWQHSQLVMKRMSL